MTSEPDEDLKKRRNEFLLHLYDNVWSSIDRSEGGIWQFVAFYAVVIALVLAASAQTVERSVPMVLALVVSFWGMNVAIDAGMWFHRNLLFAVNIEKQFLYPDDAGRVLPASYQEREVHVLNDLNAIHFAAFEFIALLTVCLSWHTAQSSAICVFTTTLLLSMVTLGHFFRARDVVSRFVADTNPDQPRTERPAAASAANVPESDLPTASPS